MELTPKVRRKLFRELERKGWRVEPSSDGWKCFSPDGKKIITIHATCSDYRAGMNILSEFKKAGFEYSGKR